MTDEADQLYELPLSEFTSARTELEKRLRKDGKREEAAEGPSQADGAGLGAQPGGAPRAKAVKELIQAGKRVRDAQEKLLAGGDRKPLDRAASAQREATKELVRAAVNVADGGGVGTGAAFEEKVGQTLRAAAADDEVAEQFAAGRLVREQEAVGLFGFDVPAAAPARETPAPRRNARVRTRATRPRAARRPQKGGEQRTWSASGSLRSRRRARPSNAPVAQRRPRSAPRPRNARRRNARSSDSRRPRATRRARGRSSRRRWPKWSASTKRAPSRRSRLSRPRAPPASICFWPRDPGYTGPAALIRSPGPGSGLGRRSWRTSTIETPGAVIDSLDSSTK